MYVKSKYEVIKNGQVWHIYHLLSLSSHCEVSMLTHVSQKTRSNLDAQFMIVLSFSW